MTEKGFCFKDLLFFIPGYYYLKNKVYSGAITFFLFWLITMYYAINTSSFIALSIGLGFSVFYFLIAKYKDPLQQYRLLNFIEFVVFFIVRSLPLMLGIFFVFFYFTIGVFNLETKELSFFLLLFPIIGISMLFYSLLHDSERKKLAKIGLWHHGEKTSKEEFLSLLSRLKKMNWGGKAGYILFCLIFIYSFFHYFAFRPEDFGGKLTWLFNPYLAWAVIIAFLCSIIIPGFIFNLKRTKSLKIGIGRSFKTVVFLLCIFLFIIGLEKGGHWLNVATSKPRELKIVVVNKNEYPLPGIKIEVPMLLKTFIQAPFRPGSGATANYYTDLKKELTLSNQGITNDKGEVYLLADRFFDGLFISVNRQNYLFYKKEIALSKIPLSEFGYPRGDYPSMPGIYSPIVLARDQKELIIVRIED